MVVSDVGIRPYILRDADEFCDLVLASKDHLNAWMPWCHDAYDIKDAETWVEACIVDWRRSIGFRYAVTCGGRIVGGVGLERVDLGHRTAELGYWMGARYTKRGIAARAGQLALLEAFGKHNLERVNIRVLPSNIASIAVAEKLGGVFEGELRNLLVHKGVSQSGRLYSVIPSDMNY